jgi:hypothetical protein
VNVAIWALTAALLAPAGAVEQARDLYQAGSRAYEQGSYPVAIRAFEEARRLVKQPAVTFSLAQAYRLQYFVDGDAEKLARAVELYRAYLEEVPQGGRRDHAAQHLSTLAPMLERVRAGQAGDAGAAAEAAQKGQIIVSSAVAGSTARLDGGDPEPIPAAFEVDAGTHRVLVEAASHQAKTVEAVAVTGGVVALNVELDPLPGHVTVHAPEGASVAIDGRVLGVSPLPEALEVPAGRHLVAVTDRGRDPFLQQLELDRGEAVEVNAALEPSGQRIASYSLFGVAGALAVGAGVATGLMFDRQSDAESLEKTLDAKGLSVDEADRYGDLESERDDFANMAIGLGAASAAVGITGLLLWIFDTPEPAGAPVITPSAGGASAAIRF